MRSKAASYDGSAAELPISCGARLMETAWHGPSLLELLEDVDAATAAAKPIPNVHSIWELLLHVAVWDRSGIDSAGGNKCAADRDGEFSSGVKTERKRRGGKRSPNRSARTTSWLKTVAGLAGFAVA